MPQKSTLNNSSKESLIYLLRAIFIRKKELNQPVCVIPFQRAQLCLSVLVILFWVDAQSFSPHHLPG